MYTARTSASKAEGAPPGHAPGRRTRTARDADDHAHNLSQWDQRYNQFSHGAFQGSVTELWLPGLQVFLESANQALDQSCAAWHDAIWFGIPRAGTSPARIDAQPVAPDTLLYRPGGRQFELQTPKDFGILGIVVGRQLLEDHLVPIEAIIDTPAGRQGALRLPAARYHALGRTLLELLFGPDPGLAGDAAAARRVSEIVLEQLAAAIASGTPATPGDRYRQIHRCRRLVDDARERVLAQPEEQLSIASLCRQLHVSRRSLQYAFREVTGLAPLAYLRALKLNQVRRHLHGADDAAGRVTRIATTWGFEHLGQFSQDYRRLFGETPSATLRHA